MKSASHRLARGFTLIEAVIVIAITGILTAIVAVFIRSPVEGYIASVRRAELTDTADVVLRRIARDVRLAVPNSLRVVNNGGMNYLEFIITSTGGRYRDITDGSVAGNFLSFTNPAVLTLDVLGPMPSNPGINAGPVGVGDYVVISNLGVGYAPGNAYNFNAAADTCGAGGCNIARVTAVNGNTLTLAANPFGAQVPALPSPNARFQVVPGNVRAVSYACPAAAAGNVTRFWNYGFQNAQPVAPVGTMSLLATQAVCTLEYQANATARNGLLIITLTLTSQGESVTLFQQVQVDNTP